MRQNRTFRGFRSVGVSTDTSDLQALYDANAAHLRGFINRKVGHPEDAEDILQESFLRMVKAYDRATPPELPHMLLWSIAIGEINRYYKGKAEQPELVSLDGIMELTDQEWDVVRLRGRSFLCEDHATLPAQHDEGVRDLPDRERDAYILTDLRGLTLREAGDVLDVSKDTVMRGRDSARLALQTYVD
jgi:RNA polymerase sigma factor (sigma-70 family)